MFKEDKQHRPERCCGRGEAEGEGEGEGQIVVIDFCTQTQYIVLVIITQ